MTDRSATTQKCAFVSIDERTKVITMYDNLENHPNKEYIFREYLVLGEVTVGVSNSGVLYIRSEFQVLTKYMWNFESYNSTDEPLIFTAMDGIKYSFKKDDLEICTTGIVKRDPVTRFFSKDKRKEIEVYSKLQVAYHDSSVEIMYHGWELRDFNN